jgi:hypothetical protein
MELAAPRKRRASWQDRRHLSSGQYRAADHLHAGGADGATVMTRRDPIVEEVRRHRAAIAREHGDDIDSIIAAFQREDAADSTRPTVSFPQKRVVKAASKRQVVSTRRPNKRLHDGRTEKKRHRPRVSRRR